MTLMEFYRKAFVRLNNGIDKNLEKCDEFYKMIYQVQKKCKLSLVAKITDLPDIDQHMAHLQDRLEEDVQHIQKVEFVNKEDVKNLVGWDFVKNHILEDVDCGWDVDYRWDENYDNLPVFNFTSEKWDISDQINDQNPHINDHFWFGDRWWLIYGLLLHDQNWSFLFWSFIACKLVIYLVINFVIY